MSVANLGYVAAVVLTLACVAVVLLLVTIRVTKDRSEARRVHLRGPVWRHVMTLSTGEKDEVEESLAVLLAAGPQDRAAVVDDAFALVPKLRGTARDLLRDVLREWGSLDDAVAQTRARSAVRRCRGIYRLGVLRYPTSRDLVLAGLDDRDFGVRRTAMLALGAFHEAEVVENLLRRAALEPRLRRDFLSSIDRIGSVAVPVLRAGLRQSVSDGESGDRRGSLAAAALGLVGAIQAVPELEQALEDGDVELKIAAIYALGELGASSSVIALAAPLGHGDADVRRAAARALGLIGGDWAVPALASVLHDDDNVEVSRAAANALHRCGAAGREVLEHSRAPVAREVVALAALGGS
ncbi:HEAT repeat domain-containing protein [Nocardioides sp. KIGAM211]|uniref:HEAT repeat domain-containing protein n=1 Tax=Nocardioides luti TaxID=2761101 RepID=A0A7X0RJ15_9ACTN|nr:HEAT repeat domain-containing protein [Nocardioides luti]MBB6629196.1 HEAT repeat domain-containing protein [Nocardioides luti]